MPSRREGRRALAPRTAFALLLLLAILHASLGVVTGRFDDGDYSLLWLAAPMMVLTALAAVATLAHSRWLTPVPVILTSISFALAFVLISAYGVGLFHLPQSALALTVALLGVRR